MHHAPHRETVTPGPLPAKKGNPDSSERTAGGRLVRILKSFSTATRMRRSVQIIVLFLVVLIGIQFAFFVASCLNPARAPVSRPPGVAGFLPITGLMGLRHWVATGILDAVQPSAAILLLLAVLVSIALKKSFCSWICPIGTLSEFLWRLREKAFPRRPRRKVPKWLDALLMAPKYLILGFFLLSIFAMSLENLSGFIYGPYNRVADVRMLAFFEHPSIMTVVVLAVLTVLSFLVKNAWCRYLCPYGALLGLVSLLSPMKIRRLDSACTGCASCSHACPMDLKVHEVGTVRSPECTGCMLCLDACPENESLTMGILHPRSRRRLVVLALALVLTVYFGGIAVAKISGRWQNGISRQVYQRIVPPVMQRYSSSSGDTIPNS